jgi:hypothetical protein
MIQGFDGSCSHNQNGMTRDDMEATALVANRLGEVIIFRSTGPWAKRWLERGYPSKNFHVKGKSSDWGPHAGLVPYSGIYSKVGSDKTKADKGTKANDEGIHSGFAGKQTLILTADQIEEQINRPEGSPARTAVEFKTAVPKSDDLYLVANRSGDRQRVLFRAFKGGEGYAIHVYPQFGHLATNPVRVFDKDPAGRQAVPLEVMISKEAGAGKPMTGDYDLFAVCPSWAQYGSLTAAPIVKPGIALMDGGLRKGLSFPAGVGMDNVMDPRLSTMGKMFQPGTNPKFTKASMQAKDFTARSEGAAARREAMRAKIRSGTAGPLSASALQQALGAPEAESPWMEHEDMGNLTPRILRCINALNAQMGAVGDQAAMRRVHHNAESHRYRLFGALTGQDMVTKKDGDSHGDGFPLTCFQPSPVDRSPGMARYGAVCTLETLLEFKQYAQALKAAGFYIPKNWVWGV